MNTKFKRFIILSAIWFAFWIFIGRHITDRVLWPCFCFGLWNIYVFCWGISALKRKITNKLNGFDDAKQYASEIGYELDMKRLEGKLADLENTIKENAEYYNSLEYKYEVLDSFSIRQLENYLEIRKKGEKY
ncbi:MAG: hypothetical protein Q4B60_05265 [Erysipelotrichaceae bacterium]|nr:hypothetical protein [Erysipelotrichaceae bacterium]